MRALKDMLTTGLVKSHRDGQTHETAGFLVAFIQKL